MIVIEWCILANPCLWILIIHVCCGTTVLARAEDCDDEFVAYFDVDNLATDSVSRLSC
jgi:hypothetical protein